ncbi:MAG: biotin/lipoyl-binding protein [Cyclobacteriaceae bacterium]|nr:biotin/lipoyl-binding protein [Cyclobacteriaceae bacterium]
MPEEINSIKVTVNGGKSLELNILEKGFMLNGRNYNWDVSRLPDGSFHIILEGRNHLAEVIFCDFEKKSFQIRMNGNPYDVQLSDRFDELLLKMGMATVHKTSDKGIKAPMPGMILKVMVKDGTRVEKGDPLVVLKAMKMENVIKSPGKASISKVLVREGQAVEKNDDLILF